MFAAPPARTMSPPPVVAVLQVPDVVQISELLSIRITPPPETSLSDQKMTSPLFVLTVWLALTFMLAPAFSVMSEPEVELVKPFTMFMSPELSTRTLLRAMAFCRSVVNTVAVPEVLDSKTPFTKDPVVGPVALMFTVDAVWLGVIVKVVPTKASEVKLKVLAPTPTFDVKPRSVNVATPPTVRTVTAVTADPLTPTRNTCPVAVMVTSCSAAPLPAVTWMD